MTHVMGDLALNSGTLAIEIGGTSPAKYDRIAVDGLTTLGGTLQVSLIENGGGVYQPQAGDQFAFLASAGGTNGAFTNMLLPELGTGLEWNLASDGAATFLAVVSVPEPGSMALLCMGMAAVFSTRRQEVV